jgi:hypothetical protein
VTDQIEVAGGSDPLVTAAILAAVARLEEERARRAATPPQPPVQGRWVRSGRPREAAPAIARLIPVADGWSVTSDEVEAPEA